MYQALCDHLEMTSHIADAIECFHQMKSELVGDSESSMDDEQQNWAAGKQSRKR